MSITPEELIHRYTDRTLSSRPENYAGRGNNKGDLNSGHLEKIYTGVKTEIGREAAKEFVQMVERMTDDASATTFLIAFKRFAYNDWKNSAHVTPSNEEKSIAEAIANLDRNGQRDSVPAVFMATFHSMAARENSGSAKNGGLEIILPFLRNHREELAGKLPDYESVARMDAAYYWYYGIR